MSNVISYSPLWPSFLLISFLYYNLAIYIEYRCVYLLTLQLPAPKSSLYSVANKHNRRSGTEPPTINWIQAVGHRKVYTNNIRIECIGRINSCSWQEVDNRIVSECYLRAYARSDTLWDFSSTTYTGECNIRFRKLETNGVYLRQLTLRYICI